MVGVGVLVCVIVRVGVPGVMVGVFVLVGVREGVRVNVTVGVRVDVLVRVGVTVRVGVRVGVGVIVSSTVVTKSVMDDAGNVAVKLLAVMIWLGSHSMALRLAAL